MYKIFLANLLVLFSVNTAKAQNVASTIEKKIVWNLQPANSQPVADVAIMPHRFGTMTIPAISASEKSSSMAEIVFSDLEYELLNGFSSYKAGFLNNVKGTTPPEVYHTMEGNQGFTGYYICPFRESNGNYYILKSFKYTLRPGKPFATIQGSAAKRAASSSVLGTGQWVKLSVDQDGIYKIDAAMLNSAGINTASLDPRTIKLYGHQGGMLPESNADFRPDDIPENAIRVVGEGDGKFDNGDYILFYAQSPNKWKYSSADSRFKHEINIYANRSYFFLTYGGTNGIRMGSAANGSSLTADASFDWFDYFMFHEDEKENICNEGRIVLGEKFDQNLVYNFSQSLPNITANKPIKIYYAAGAIAPTTNSSMTLMVNNVLSSTTNFNQFMGDHDCMRYGGEVLANVSGSSSSLNLSFVYDKPNTSSRAWLDYYEIHCSRKLAFSEGYMPFQNIASATSSIAEYRLSGLPGSYQIFDVTDPLNIKSQDAFADNSDFVFRAVTGGVVRRYILTDGNTMSPVFEGNVPNQNLHATGVTQFIIVSPPEFSEAANKLADFHKTRDNLSVLVVTPQQIYNEFSSGSQDISAIRDFFRHVYYSNNNPVNQLRYAMFMGDASYDYKDKITNNSNYVPTYESEPMKNIGAPWYYCSDDFFGFLDPQDGSWQIEQKLEIPVTRLPVASPLEALGVVNKIINYKNTASFGDWRTFITFCADDVDDTWETMFVNDFEDIYRMVDTTFKNINVRKVYIDAFKQQNLGGSQRYPEAQEAIKKEFEKGTLVFNYIGHGGEEYLAKEKVIDIPLINGLSNINNLPVFFTATCEFSRYDDGKRKSAGEFVITNPNGGSVAMFTTVRVVYAQPNAELTKDFWRDYAFTRIGGKWPTLGQIYKNLKNRSTQTSNDRNFTLFADPALSMNYPENIIIIDSINQASASNKKDTVSALDKVKFSGHIENLQGQRLNDFNGKILPTVYDKPSKFLTLSNDLPGYALPFDLYSSILYRGENSVTNGLYSFSFVVPKDINYNYGFGKISMYADNGIMDANGHYTDFVVGGTSSAIIKDITGPQVELFVDDYSFVSGGMTDNTPLLLARIFDENGVNTSGNGIGRDIVAIIDKGTASEKKYILNSYYKGKLNSYTSGDISYQLEGLEDGMHTYTLKVWDSYNNSSESTIEFQIKNNDQISISHLLNYPNPFSNNTTFHFDHNKAGENLDITITIMTITGKVLKTIDQTITSASGHVSDIHWNGRDDYEDKPSKGVYIYRIVIRTEDGKKAEKVEKLVILN
jgi:hypothetical protein